MINKNFLDSYTDFIFVKHEVQKADIIFIPGNTYPQMAEQAADLYKAGYAPWLLPSGKYGIKLEGFPGVHEKQECYNQEYQTEWAFLKDVLTKNQVPEYAILQEEEATYTYENAIYSRKRTDSLGLDIKKAIICCTSTHAKRCLLYYQLLYPDTTFFVSPTDIEGITRATWYQTEKGRKRVLGEVERCVNQFQEIFQFYSSLSSSSS